MTKEQARLLRFFIKYPFTSHKCDGARLKRTLRTLEKHNLIEVSYTSNGWYAKLKPQ